MLPPATCAAPPQVYNVELREVVVDGVSTVLVLGAPKHQLDGLYLRGWRCTASGGLVLVASAVDNSKFVTSTNTLHLQVR